MQPKKRRTRTNRVERQIELAGRARALEEQASELVDGIQIPEGLVDTDRRKGSTRAYHMALLEEKIKYLWAHREDYPQHRDVVRSAMTAWNSMEMVTWELAMTSKRVADLEARRLTRQFENEEDLRQDGYIGLVRAAKRFDPGQGVKFDTYARWWARAEMTRAMEQRGRTIRIPAGAAEQLRLIQRVKSEWDKAGIEYTYSNIAEVLNLETKRVHRLLSVGQAVSLETEVDVGPKTRTLAEVMEEEVAADPETFTTLQDQLGRLQDVLQNLLNDRERQVLTRRYGIEDHEFRTLKQIGLEMGISRERVRQIEILAFDKIRKSKLFRETRRPWTYGRAA